jgi:hypothetical protein
VVVVDAIVVISVVAHIVVAVDVAPTIAADVVVMFFCC